MAFQLTSVQYPVDNPLLGTYGFVTGLLIDATGEKIALIGDFYNASHETKSIRKVGIRFGTVTKAGGSGLTISLQDVSTTSNPAQPDGTQDETVAVANGNADFAANTFLMTGNLSADRSVAFGEKICVVIEYDGSGRQGSDSVTVVSINHSGVAFPTTALFTASWASSARTPNVIFECSDGTFAALNSCGLFSNSSAVAFNSGSNPDEYGNVFQVPYGVKCDGAWVVLSAGTTADFDVVLYSGTTALATETIDGHTINAASAGRVYVSWSEVELSANTDYILAVKPTTANNVTLNFVDVADALHWAPTGVASCSQVTRVNAGSWGSPLTTRRIVAGINISAIDTGSGGGSGSSITAYGHMS